MNHAEAALKLALEKGLKPGDVIPIAVYDKESFKALRNPDGMSFLEHREAVTTVVDVLTSHGFNAVPVEIKISEYLEWLGEDLNSSQNRAAFVALKLKLN